MGINSNEFSPESDPIAATVQENQKAHTSFTGAELGSEGAPSGAADFLSLTAKIGINRIDSTVGPYLEKVLKVVKENLPEVALERLVRTNNAYTFRFNGPDGTINLFGIQFVNASDPKSQNFVPASWRLKSMQKEIEERYAGKTSRISDARVILAGYEPDMAKWEEMADTIVRTFQVTSLNELKNAQIMALTSNEFVADWSLSNAKAAENSLSPHGIRPRMDVGLTISAKVRNEMGRDFREFGDEYRLLGVIGGYTEIREREMFEVNGVRQLLYRPVFNITVCNAVIPLEGVAAILMAALAATIYNSKFWAKQWQDLQDGQPNPGMLEEDPANRGRPIILKDMDELKEFVDTYFAPPVIAFQFLDGRDSIPGVWRMGATEGKAKNHFVNRLTHFFGAQEENGTNVELSRIIEYRFDGAYGDPRGILNDSRDIDFLHIAAKNGIGSIDANMRRTLLGGAENSTDRARLVDQATGGLIPLFLNTVAIINPDFVKWIVSKTDARRLVIVDPNHQTEARSIGSYLDGFGSSSNMGSIVSSGVVNRGLNLQSVWNY